MPKALTYISLFFVLFVANPISSHEYPCPNDMVIATNNVCIDRFEWPNIPGSKPLLGISGVPVKRDVAAGITMNAEQLCSSIGKRVCTSEEWLIACEGSNDSDYPFGNELPKYIPGENNGLCNYDKFYIEINERKVRERDPDEMAKLDQSEPAGSRGTCKSRSGAYDMIGNAEEWVKCSSGKYGWCLAGRFWAKPVKCKEMIVTHAPRWYYPTTSTRCCLDVGDPK